MFRSAVLLGLLTFGWAAGARAEPPTVEELTALGEAVRGTEVTARQDAIAAFALLGEDALPALTARVAAVRRERRGGEDGYRAIGDFGRAAGATSPAEPVDVIAGIPKVLDAGASPVHGRMAERLLLLRALERIGTARAVIAMLPILTTDMIAFRWEARHLVRRMGRVTIAALIRAAQSPLPEVDLFAGWGFGELGVLDAGHAVQDQTAESLAEIIRAYSEVKHLGAMPTVASFVGDDRVVVRTAAHDGMLAYAENGIWQLRSLHEGRIGRASPAGATFRDLLARLEAHADDRRAAPFRARMAAADEASAAGRLDDANRLATDVEARAYGLPELTRLAPVHAENAARALAAGDLDVAGEGYRRALLLAPSDANAAVWTERLAEIETARVAREGIEPWPDAPVLAAARTESTPSRVPYLLALIGVVLLAAPRAMARLPKVRLPATPRLGELVGAIERFIAVTRARVAAQAPADHEDVVETPPLASAAPDDTLAEEEESMKEPEHIAPREEEHVEDAALAARARLARAAEAARARLSSRPPAAGETPSTYAAPLRPIAMPIVEVAPIVESTPVVDAPSITEEAAFSPEKPSFTETPSPVDADVEIAVSNAPSSARTSEIAEPATVAPRIDHAATTTRRERPVRRAALSPSLVFGASTSKVASKKR